MTFGGGTRDRAAGDARFVVGMGVEAHDRRHRRPVCQRRTGVDSATGSAVDRSACRTAADAISRRLVAARPSRPAPRGCADRRGPEGASISGAVRLNRGAGAGWTTPSTSMNVWRSTLCGCCRRFAHREHRREADVGHLHDRAPLGPGLLGEHLGEPRLQVRPARRRPSALANSSSPSRPVRRSSSA